MLFIYTFQLIYSEAIPLQKHRAYLTFIRLINKLMLLLFFLMTFTSS